MRACALVLAVALMAGAAAAQPRGPLPSINAAAPPSAMERAPRLPEGRLQKLGVTHDPDAAHWIALDDVSRRGPLVEATVLTVLDKAETRKEQPALMIVSRQAVWCDSRTVATYHAWYSADAVLLDAVQAFEPKPLQPGSVSAMLAAHVCDGAPAGETVEGFQESLRLTAF